MEMDNSLARETLKISFKMEQIPIPNTNLTKLSLKMLLSLPLRLAFYSCIVQSIGTTLVSQTCNIARPCAHGNISISIQTQVDKLHCWLKSEYLVDKLMDIGGTEQLPGSESECPIPNLPRQLKRKSRYKATLKNFYQGFAFYLLLVDEIAGTHTQLESEIRTRLAIPMCDILCLGFTKLKSRKKTQNIARKVTKKYKKFTTKDTNTCKINQPVTIIENLSIYLKNALPGLKEKKNRRKRRRATKPKKSKTRQRKSKQLKTRKRRGRKGKGFRKQRKGTISRQRKRA